MVGDIFVSHCCDYEEYWLLGCDTVWSGDWCCLRGTCCLCLQVKHSCALKMEATDSFETVTVARLHHVTLQKTLLFIIFSFVLKIFYIFIGYITFSMTNPHNQICFLNEKLSCYFLVCKWL